MKPRLLFLLVSLVIFAPSIARPQSKPSQNADNLKRKVEALENADVTSTSPTVQDVYRRTLLRLYSQYLEAINSDVAALKIIGANAEGITASETEITSRLSSLKAAQDMHPAKDAKPT